MSNKNTCVDNSRIYVTKRKIKKVSNGGFVVNYIFKTIYNPTTNEHANVIQKTFLTGEKEGRFDLILLRKFKDKFLMMETISIKPETLQEFSMLSCLDILSIQKHLNTFNNE